MRGVQVHRNQTLVPTDQEPGGALADAAVVASVAVVTSVVVSSAVNVSLRTYFSNNRYDDLSSLFYFFFGVLVFFP